jgi:two-component system, OmpR family, sensor histidine kinase PrrB
VRLSTRTGLAAFAAASLSLTAIGLAFHGVFARVLLDRVDAQLEARAQTAPILAAIADRLATSELNGTVQGARVLANGHITDLGLLPSDPLPEPAAPGWVTADADGQRWRLLTIEVRDVPDVGDVALVQLAAPLGDTEAASRRLRRRAILVGITTALGAGGVGYGLGALALRPLTVLRRDAARLDDSAPDQWQVGSHYGSVEIDEVAATLNHSLGRLADETQRRGAALESARAFASAATHELRAPLQSALTNLNLVATGQLGADETPAAVARATGAVQQTAAALAAVRSLAEAEFADPSWFAPADLADLVEAAVAAETGRREVGVELVTPGERATAGSAADHPAPVLVWAAGVQLAVANVVRNALVHGRPPDGEPIRLTVTVEGPEVVVDDNGPGIASEDRHRVLERFERGSRAPGTGLGLAIARQVTLAHGGAITIGYSPLGGARLSLRFAPEPR